MYNTSMFVYLYLCDRYISFVLFRLYMSSYVSATFTVVSS